MILVMRIFLFILLSFSVSCSRYAPLTSTKINLSGIQEFKTKSDQLILSGLNSNGEYFSMLANSGNVDEIELTQGTWTFYGIHISSTPGETRCALTEADLIAEKQNITITYDKKTCGNSAFGDKVRFNKQKNHLNPAKIFLCESIRDATKDCGSNTPSDAKSIRFMIMEAELSDKINPKLKSSGIDSGCISLNSTNGLIQTENLFTLPIGNVDSLPFPTKIKIYQDENCQGDSISYETSRLLNDKKLTNTTKIHEADFSYYLYEVDLINSSTEDDPSNATLLGFNEICTKSEECESQKCGLKNNPDYKDTQNTTDKFISQCYGKLYGEACSKNADCQSDLCVKNGSGELVCAKNSHGSYENYCYSDSDCISGKCNLLTSTTSPLKGGTCDSIKNQLTDYAMSLNASDSSAFELGTHVSISGKDDFSVSIWFNTNSTAPMILFGQRDSANFQGGFGIGLNGAAPSFVGYGNTNYNLANSNTINFSFFENSSKNIHLIASPLSNFLDEKWHYLVATRETKQASTFLKIYLDGSLIAEQDYTLEINLVNTIESFLAGNVRDSRDYFSGKINQFNTWNSALSLSQVQDLYRMGMNQLELQNNDDYSPYLNSEISFDSIIKLNGVWNTEFFYKSSLGDQYSSAQLNKSTSNSFPFWVTSENNSHHGCWEDYECHAFDSNMVCNSIDNICVLPPGKTCNNNEDCLNQKCVANTCQIGTTNDLCFSSNDCESKICNLEDNTKGFRRICKDSPIGQISMKDEISSGLTNAIIYFTMQETAGNKVSFYTDDSCINNLLGSQQLDGSFSYDTLLSNFQLGENSIYFQYTNGADELGPCQDSKVSYYAFEENYDFKQAYLEGKITITTRQSSDHSSGQFTSEKAIDGIGPNVDSSMAHTDSNGQETPHWWEFEFDEEKVLSELVFYSRDANPNRFRDLDAIVYDSSDNVVYQYSTVAGALFKQGVNNGVKTWTLNFKNSDSTIGGINNFIRAKRVRLTRTKATTNIGGYTEADKYLINLAEVDIIGIGPHVTDDFISPPLSMILDLEATATNKSYTFNLTGNFPDGLITLYTDSSCSDFAGSVETAKGDTTAQIEFSNILYGSQTAGKINLYTKVQNKDLQSSQCSAIWNVSSEINYGPDSSFSCSADNQCVSSHPYAECNTATSRCKLPGNIATPDASWCASGSKTGDFCDEVVNSMVGSLKFQNNVTSGINKAIVTMEMTATSGSGVKLFTDNSCTTNLKSINLTGDSTYTFILENIPEGANTIFHKFINDNGGESSCISLNQTYTVLSETDLKQDQLDGNFNITATQSSVYSTYDASFSIDQYPANNIHDPVGGAGPISLSHTATTDYSPWWEITFDNEIPITYFKIYSRILGTNPNTRFRDLNVIGKNTNGTIVYDFSAENGSLYREHGIGDATGVFEIDFDNSILNNGSINSPIFVKSLRLSRTQATQNLSSYNDDNWVLNIMDIDLKGWKISNTDFYVAPIYKMEINVEMTGQTGSPVFDVFGNFNSSNIYLYADNTCSSDVVGFAENITGNTAQITASEFNSNDYPLGAINFYAVVEDGSNHFSHCSVLNNASDTYNNTNTAATDLVDSFSFQNEITKGINKAILTMSMSDTTGEKVQIFSDNNCSSILHTVSLSGLSSYTFLMQNLPIGFNTFYYKFTDASGAHTTCNEINENYEVLEQTSLRQYNNPSIFTMTPNQSSTWVDQNPAFTFGPENALDSSNNTLAHTALNDTTPFWEVTFNQEVPITFINFLDRNDSDWSVRWHDLDITLYNSAGQEIYRYSGQNSGNLYRQTSNPIQTESSSEFRLDFLTKFNTLLTGSVPIFTKKIKLERTNQNQGTAYTHDNYLINFRTFEAKSLNVEKLTNLVLPGYKISLNETETMNNKAYTFDVYGNFNTHDIYIHANEFCIDDPIATAYNVSGTTVQLIADNLSPGDYLPGNLNFYTISEDGSGNKSACSRVYDVKTSVAFGLDAITTCANDNNCILGHPQAKCLLNKCMLPSGIATPKAAWCMSATATNKICDKSSTGFCLDDNDCAGTATCNPQHKCTGGGGGGGGGGSGTIDNTSSCTSDADCNAIEANTICRVSGINNGYCAYLPGETTTAAALCLSNDMDTSTSCLYSSFTNLNSECQANEHCISQICVSTLNKCGQGGKDDGCYENGDCLSQSCSQTTGTCAASTIGQVCRTTEDCDINSGLSCNMSNFTCQSGP